MKKYKVTLSVDRIVKVTCTVHAYSADGAVYRAKLKLKVFDDFGELKFNTVYVEEVKDGD